MRNAFKIFVFLGNSPTAGAFLRQSSGALAPVFGLALVVIVGFAGAAIDFGQQQLAKQKLWQSASLACQYARRTSTLANTTTGQQAVKSFFDANLSQQNVPVNSIASTFNSTTSGPGTMAASYEVPTSFLGLFSIPSLSVAVSQQCYATPPLVPGTVVLQETFETPPAADAITRDCGPGCFRYVSSYNGWKTSGGTGELEISDGYKIAPPEGTHVGELTPDYNGAISKKVYLAPGTYELRYFYVGGPYIPVPDYYGWTTNGSVYFYNDPLPLCSKTAANVEWATQDKSRIGVYFSADSADFSAQNLTAANNPTSKTWRPADLVDVCIYSYSWVERSATITVPTAGNYWLTFAAQGGNADREGGQIDNIRVCYQACAGDRRLSPMETPGHVVFADDFERPYTTASPYLQTTIAANGWTTTPYDSVQIFTNGDAPQGRQYLELDTDINYSGTSTTTLSPGPSNRAISRRFLFSEGTYQLAYWYKPRVRFALTGTFCGSTAAAAQSGYPTGTASVTATTYSAPTGTYDYNTSQIGVYLDSDLTTAGSTRPTNPLDICMFSNGWVQRYVTFVISKPGFYWFTMRAEGVGEGYGANVDDVRICAVACSGGPTNQTKLAVPQ
ncbi:MAG: hypothetical protein BVN31_01935 [Proteobacteria bacterium ST_bin15]|nr:MAG: hypothetical protein BVN31_01935 [Proteobacteria bacterium ST_bin15]